MHIPAIWGQSVAPPLENWIKAVENTCLMEELTLIARDKLDRHTATWARWIEFKSSTDYKNIMYVSPGSAQQTLPLITK